MDELKDQSDWITITNANLINLFVTYLITRAFAKWVVPLFISIEVAHVFNYCNAWYL